MSKYKFDKKDIILLALSAASSSDQEYDSVQVQKLLFLIDKKIGNQIGGPYFHFIPYNYGPFDKEIYSKIAELSTDTQVSINKNRDITYKLTAKGKENGDKLMQVLSKEIQTFIKNLNTFVTELSFSDLIAAIYKEYPEMRKNSIFFG